VKLIDSGGLSDAPIPANLLIKALGLEGYVIPPQEEIREGVLAWLRQDKPTDPVTVYTGPQAAQFWSFAPAWVEVVIVPGEREIARAKRAETAVEWELVQAGLGLTEAKALALKPPTSKHKHYLAYIQAIARAYEWQDIVPVSPSEGGFDYVGPRPTQDVPYTWSSVTSLSLYTDLSNALALARQEDHVVGLDVETDEEDQIDVLVGVGFAFGNKCYYLPLNGPLGSEMALGLLRYNFVEHNPVKFVAHNGKFDLQALVRAICPESEWPSQLRRLAAYLVGDGFIAAYIAARVTKDGRPEEKGLKPLARRFFGVDMVTFKEMLASCGAEKSSDAPIEVIGPYCCADAFWGVQVEAKLVKELNDTSDSLVNLYRRLELPLVGCLADMELQGVPVNLTEVKKLASEYRVRVATFKRYLQQAAKVAGYGEVVKRKRCPNHLYRKAEYQVCRICDIKGMIEISIPFNPASGPQLSEVLQGAFGLPRFASTAKDDASNDEAALLKLREHTDQEDAKEFITFLLAYRKDVKVYGYLQSFQEKAREAWNGVVRIHGKFNQAVVESGRLSSKDPNLQNIPPNLRGVFYAP
jgi:hypothetical protein